MQSTTRLITKVHIGLIVELQQQINLPLIDDTRSNTSQVGIGEQKQQLQPLAGPHDRGELNHRILITQIKPKGGVGEQQMLTDQEDQCFFVLGA